MANEFLFSKGTKVFAPMMQRQFPKLSERVGIEHAFLKQTSDEKIECSHVWGTRGPVRLKFCQ